MNFEHKLSWARFATVGSAVGANLPVTESVDIPMYNGNGIHPNTEIVANEVIAGVEASCEAFLCNNIPRSP